MNDSYTIHEATSSIKSLCYWTTFHHSISVFTSSCIILYFADRALCLQRVWWISANNLAAIRSGQKKKVKCLTFSKHCLKMHTKGLFNGKNQHNKDSTINHQTVSIFSVMCFLCRPRGVHHTPVPEGSLHGAAAEAPVRFCATCCRIPSGLVYRMTCG